MKTIKYISNMTLALLCYALCATSCAKGETTDIDISPQGTSDPKDVVVDMEPTYIDDQDVIIKSGYSQEYIRVSGLSTVTLVGEATEVLDQAYISLDDDDTWLQLPNVTRAEWTMSGLSKRVLINGKELRDGTNADIYNYYYGIMIKPTPDESYTPFSSVNGADSKVYMNTIYKSGSLPGGDNGLNSFTLKRGHMVVIAENEDGTGARETFMAIGDDLEVSLQGTELAGKASFLRAVQAPYVCKRGTGGADYASVQDIVGSTWYYRWGLGDGPTKDIDTAPMFWGAGAVSNYQNVISWPLANHVLGYNEPDGEKQANLTNERALELYPDILQVGLRTGSPSCEESNWKSGKWNYVFINDCEKAGYAIDFICVHWYNWGNYSANQNGATVAAQFMSHLQECYNLYGKPIWITEFNANTNRNFAHQVDFLNNVIPLLEECEYVERYAYFQPGSGNGNYLDGSTPTDVASAYNSVVSTPAIKDTHYDNWNASVGVN